VSPRRRAIRVLHRTRVAHRADRWSDPRAAVRASVETPPYHDGIFVVSTPSPCARQAEPPILAELPTMNVVAAELQSETSLATESFGRSP
jgi:hypothetical protein